MTEISRQIILPQETVSVDEMILDAERLRLLARVAELEAEVQGLQGGE